MLKRTFIIIVVTAALFSCSKTPEGPFYISSVLKELPEGKIKVAAKNGKMASMTHKTFIQSFGDEKHKLKECKIIDLIFNDYSDKKIVLSALHRKCTGKETVKEENFVIIYKKPCVFLFETILIQVVRVNRSEVHFRIIRDKG